jgi:hypothetical protein
MIPQKIRYPGMMICLAISYVSGENKIFPLSRKIPTMIVRKKKMPLNISRSIPMY